MADERKRPYIRKVVIHGFKTYGVASDIEEFDEGMNVLGTQNEWILTFSVPLLTL